QSNPPRGSAAPASTRPLHPEGSRNDRPESDRERAARPLHFGWDDGRRFTAFPGGSAGPGAARERGEPGLAVGAPQSRGGGGALLRHFHIAHRSDGNRGLQLSTASRGEAR